MNVKEKALELIAQHNLEGKSYDVIPREDFGEDFFEGQFLYYAHYTGKNNQRVAVGFKQYRGHFFSYGENKPLNVDQAIEGLVKQLSEIPLK